MTKSYWSGLALTLIACGSPVVITVDAGPSDSGVTPSDAGPAETLKWYSSQRLSCADAGATLELTTTSFCGDGGAPVPPPVSAPPTTVYADDGGVLFGHCCR